MPPAKRSDSIPSWILFAGAALAVVVFVGGYHSGGQSEARSANEQVFSIHQREKAVRDKLKKCQDSSQSTSTKIEDMQGESKELAAENMRLQRENEALYQQNEELESKNSACIEDGESQRLRWSEHDEENRKIIEEISGQNRVLILQSKQIAETKGMRSVLLNQAITKLKRENFDLRLKLGLPVPDTDYFDGLIKKWEAANPSSKPKGLAPLKSSEMKQLNRTIAMWKPFAYDPRIHKNIFFPKITEDGTVERPVWMGRTGALKPTRGTFLGKKFAPFAPLQSVMRALFTYATCAYLNNNTNFTFPATFYRHPGAPGQNLTFANDVIDTPLITFCTDCVPMAGTPEFRLACLGDTIDVRYGTYAFWSTRSRIRLQPKFYLAANEFFKGHKMTAGNYIAVLFKRSDFLKQRCQMQNSMPLRHYVWLNGNYKNVKFAHATQDAKEQCYPTTSTLIAAVKGIVKSSELKQVYLSIDQGEQDHLPFLDAMAKDLPDVQIIVGEPTSITADAVDIIVASKAAELLVNAYSEHSQMVTEFYLLEKQLAPEGITFW